MISICLRLKRPNFQAMYTTIFMTLPCLLPQSHCTLCSIYTSESIQNFSHTVQCYTSIPLVVLNFLSRMAFPLYYIFKLENSEITYLLQKAFSDIPQVGPQFPECITYISIRVYITLYYFLLFPCLSHPLECEILERQAVGQLFLYL